MAPRCDHLLCQMSVIATLLPHERVAFGPDGIVQKQSPDAMTAITRTLKGDSRETTIVGVRKMIEELDGIIRTELTRVGGQGAPNEALGRALVEWGRTLTAAAAGLGNLKVTYATDASAAAGVTRLIASIHELVSAIDGTCGTDS